MPIWRSRPRGISSSQVLRGIRSLGFLLRPWGSQGSYQGVCLPMTARLSPNYPRWPGLALRLICLLLRYALWEAETPSCHVRETPAGPQVPASGLGLDVSPAWPSPLSPALSLQACLLLCQVIKEDLFGSLFPEDKISPLVFRLESSTDWVTRKVFDLAIIVT